MTTSRPQTQIQDEEIILRPTVHITQAGREYKNIMRRIWRACNYWIKCPKDRQKIYGNIGEAFYNVALIVDDMEDHTILRRGIPAAHMVYGIPLTVQATIYKTILSLEELFLYLEDSKEEATDSLIKLGTRLFAGQGIEIHFTDIVKCPTFDDYRAIIYGKSFAVIHWGVRLLELFAKKEKIQFGAKFWDNLSYFAAVYDDYVNLHNPKWASVRVYCDDLDEGKFSFPMIHAIQSHPNDHRLLTMLKNRPLDMESKKLFVDIMESFGSFEYTRKLLEDTKNGVFDEVDKMKIGKNPHLQRVLEDIFTKLETDLFIDKCN
ncbi:terpene synthase-like [Zophobas morio]|uniref:terpene synthase-like n=1 Tax=Zophobas morio TaxID=2755281 RepID=UPI0030832341